MLPSHFFVALPMAPRLLIAMVHHCSFSVRACDCCAITHQSFSHSAACSRILWLGIFRLVASHFSRDLSCLLKLEKPSFNSCLSYPGIGFGTYFRGRAKEHHNGALLRFLSKRRDLEVINMLSEILPLSNSSQHYEDGVVGRVVKLEMSLAIALCLECYRGAP